MVFIILISIVFIAELIITFTVILNLIRLDKGINALNETITITKPGLREICILVKKISCQLKELSARFVQKLEANRDEIILGRIARIILGALLFKKLRKSKFTKILAKGLSLLQIVV